MGFLEAMAQENMFEKDCFVIGVRLEEYDYNGKIYPNFELIIDLWKHILNLEPTKYLKGLLSFKEEPISETVIKGNLIIIYLYNYVIHFCTYRVIQK